MKIKVGTTYASGLGTPKLVVYHCIETNSYIFIIEYANVEVGIGWEYDQFTAPVHNKQLQFSGEDILKFLEIELQTYDGDATVSPVYIKALKNAINFSPLIHPQYSISYELERLGL